MVFLNLLLAGGLAAISAPIIIHLIHRSRVNMYDWGAMIFLEELMAAQARKIKLRELLLLLVRCLIVGCLALALMRPAFKWASSGVRAPGLHTSAVLLLDDSYSMNAGRPRNAWQDACDEALQYIDTLRKGDDVTIMLTSSAGKGQAPAALFDLDRARELVRAAKPSQDKSDMPRAFVAALQQLENQHNPRRELVLFSDMQATGWELKDGARWSFVSGTVRSMRANGLDPNIVLASVAPARPNNVALTELTPSREVVDCFSPVTFNLSVVNEGAEEARDVTVTFIVDGAPKATRTINLAVGGKETLPFENRFEQPGSHYVSCKLHCAQDVLPDDDEIFQSVVVIDKLPVLLVDGDHRDDPLASETGFLRMALSPRDDSDPTWRTVIESTVIDTTDLRYTDLSKFRVIVLANVAALPASVVGELERFVVAGGGLFVTLGDRVMPENYNRDLFRQGAGLLPVALQRAPVSPMADPERAVRLVSAPAGAPPAMVHGDEVVHLASIVSNAPALDLFRPEKGQDWSRARIRRYVPTAAPPGSEDVRVIASYSNGQAALVQKKLGEGKVLLFTSAVDLDWSDMPVHPFYVPLMQNLVLDLASAIIPPRNLQVGQSIVYVSPNNAGAKPHLLYPPKGEPVKLKLQRQGLFSVVSWDKTAEQGLYAVAPEGGTPDSRIYYSVTADRSESDLTRLEPGDYKRLENDLGAKHAESWENLARMIGLDAGGYEITQFLIMASVLFCFFEIYLTRRWA